MNNLAGTQVRGYLLQNSIGTGGFGNVYQALQPSVNREVAIKVILPKYANKPEFIRRFETEAQLIARLEHIHIVPLYDYWRDPDGAYLVMRLMRGGNLENYIKSEQLDLETIAKLVDQIASALESAHTQGIIHRDIKPSNILLDQDRNAYLSDFGIAKELEQQNSDLSQTDAIIGTPDYLAPEQAMKEKITPRTDIYSFGVLLYEMLVGEHPFPNISWIERLFKHINEPLPFIKSLEPGISDAVNQVVQTATHKNPDNRFSTASELAKAFRDAASLTPSKMDSQLVELLTPREQEVLSCLILGMSNWEIAEKLTVEFTTVKWYIRQIYKKLNVRSRVQAIVRARELNLIISDQKKSSLVSSAKIYLPTIKNPYKGLKAFQAIDEQDYFGREDLIQKLLERLNENHKYARFLAVVGPSGSGKSSLVKAGLIPALWRGKLPGSGKWFIVDMVLGEYPFDELEVALIKIATDRHQNLREQLLRDPRGLVRAVNLILPDDGSELVLILDQFEEIFTLVKDEETRRKFLEMLYTAVLDSRSRIRIVLTLRADFYDRPLHYPDFGDLVRSRIETIMPLTAEELERAIIQPARRMGVKFEEGLVASIINGVHYQSGALPLMQYALTELFENQENRIITHENYNQIGGVIGAIAKGAEEIYRELDPNGKEAVHQLFLRLVNLGEGSEDTKRRVNKAELLSITEDPELMDEIIDTFANYRLLSLDHDPLTRSPVVEVAHEAILHEWERLDIWLDESRGDIRQERVLANACKEWQENKEDTSFLMRGTRLEYFENWVNETSLALTPLEIRYIQQSISERDREKELELQRAERERRLVLRNQRFLQAMVIVFALAAVISFLFANSARESQRIAVAEAQARATSQVIAEQEKEEAVHQAEARATAEAIALDERQQALIQASIGLAALSEQELVGFYPERSVLLALEALENYPYTPQAYHALVSAVYSSRLRMTIDAHQGLIFRVLLSQDGSKILSSAQDGIIKVWDYSTGKNLLSIDTGKNTAEGIWSPDETMILVNAYNSEAGWVKLEEGILVAIYDAQTGEKLIELPAGEDRYTCWTPDSTKVITSRGSNLITIWDAQTGEKLQVLDKHTAISRVRGDPETWSPDGIHFVSSGEDGTAIIWNIETGEDEIILAGHEGVVMYAEYSPNGEMIATLGETDGKVIVWDALTGEEIFTYRPNYSENQWTDDISWSPDSAHLAVEAWYMDPVILDAASGEIVYSLPGHVGASLVSWSPNGDLILTGSQNGIGYVWDVASGNKVFTIYGHTSSISRAIWSADGTQFITAGDDGTIKIWETNTAPLTTKGFSFPLIDLTGGGAWSPDGNLFARAYLDGTIIIWDTHSGEAVRQIEGLSFGAYVMDWYPDGRLLVNDSIFGNLIKIFDSNTGELLKVIEADIEVGGMVMLNLKFSPDGSKIAAADFGECSAMIFDAESGELLQRLYHEAGVWGVGWSPDGTKLATSSWDDTAKVWDLETGEVLLDLYPEDYGFFVFSVAFSPDGNRIVSGAGGGQAFIWDLTGEQDPLELIGHTSDFTGFWWSPDGTYILSSNNDGTGRVWDTETGMELCIYEIGLTSMAYLSPDGKRVAFSVADGTVRFYPVMQEVDDLIEYAYECCMVRDLTEQERRMFGLTPPE